MGYDAFVVCDCYKKGKTSKPPFEEYVKLDEDGLHIHPPNKQVENEMYIQFDYWKQNACKHDDMDYCCEWLSNGSGMAYFKSLFQKLGGKYNYPILEKYLPVLNGGILPVELAQDALLEVLDIQKMDGTVHNIILFELLSQDIHAITHEDNSTVFMSNRSCLYGINAQGFFIAENSDDSNVLFRSKHFIEQKISHNQFRFIDVNSGQYFVSEMSLNSYNNYEQNNYEFIIKVEEVNIVEQIGYILETLKKLLNASITTGNPIHWC